MRNLGGSLAAAPRRRGSARVEEPMRSSEAAVEADDGRTTLLLASVARVSIRRPRLAYTRCNRSCCHVTRG